MHKCGTLYQTILEIDSQLGPCQLCLSACPPPLACCLIGAVNMLCISIKYSIYIPPITKPNPKALHPAPIFICIVKPISTLMRVDLWPLCPYGGSTLADAVAAAPVCCLSCHANCLQICLAAVKVLLKIRY